MNASDVDNAILPNDRSAVRIRDYCNYTKSGSTPSRKNNEYWLGGTIPWLKSGEVDNNVSIFTEEYVTELAVAKTATKLLPRGTVLMAMYGVTAGKVGLLDIDACTNQAICGMYCNNPDRAAYLYFALLRDQDAISRLANGGAQNNLSKELIDNTYILVPDDNTLCHVGVKPILDLIRANYHEIAALESLKEALLGILGR